MGHIGPYCARMALQTVTCPQPVVIQARLEDAALRINKRDALTIEDEARFQFFDSQMVVRFIQPSGMFESCQANRRVHAAIGS